MPFVEDDLRRGRPARVVEEDRLVAESRLSRLAEDGRLTHLAQEAGLLQEAHAGELAHRH